MGLFAYRCGITGVDLSRSSSVAYVLLEQTDTGFRPAACPLWGVYDGYGSTEDIATDPHATVVATSLERLLTRGTLMIAERAAPASLRDWSSLEGILAAVERANTSHQTDAILSGTPISFTLVDGGVMRALVDESPLRPPVPRDRRELVEEAFGPSKLAQEIYLPAENLPSECLDLIRGTLAVTRALGSLDHTWQSPSESSQYNGSDARKLLNQAVHKFAKNTPIIEALTQYDAYADFDD